MSQHTPEPWKVSTGNLDEDGRRFLSIVDSLNRVICQTVSIPQADQRIGSPYTREANDANAARIVAAVNVVTGMTTEDLQTLGLGALANLYRGNR